MPPPFSVSARLADGRHVVAPCGEVDLVTVDEVGAALDASASGPLVLDLREVSFMDTSGLQLLVERQRQAEAGGRAFAIVPGPPQIQRLLDIAGLTDRLHIDGRSG